VPTTHNSAIALEGFGFDSLAEGIAERNDLIAQQFNRI